MPPPRRFSTIDDSRVHVVNLVPYLELEVLGTGASSVVLKCEMLVPVSVDLAPASGRSPWKRPAPQFQAQADGWVSVAVLPRAFAGSSILQEQNNNTSYAVTKS